MTKYVICAGENMQAKIGVRSIKVNRKDQMPRPDTLDNDLGATPSGPSLQVCPRKMGNPI